MDYAYHENWSNKVEENVTYQMRHNEGVGALPDKDSIIIVHVNDPNGVTGFLRRTGVRSESSGDINGRFA